MDLVKLLYPLVMSSVMHDGSTFTTILQVFIFVLFLNLGPKLEILDEEISPVGLQWFRPWALQGVKLLSELIFFSRNVGTRTLKTHEK